MGRITNQCGLQQGCTLSKALHALCMHPLPCTLDQSTWTTCRTEEEVPTCTGICSRCDGFVTHPVEFSLIRQAIQGIQNATGAKLNLSKSMGMVLGCWTSASDRITSCFPRNNGSTWCKLWTECTKNHETQLNRSNTSS